jgi:phage virion morphogenesis protein
MQIVVNVDSAKVQAALSKAAEVIGDTQPMLTGVGARLEANIRSRFDTKRDPAGRAWEPYKAISAAIHEAITGKPQTGTLMERTGNLRAGVESHVVGDTLEVGTTAPYARFHEFGTAGKTSKTGKTSGAIPRRGLIFGAVSGVGAAAQVTQALGADDEADVLDVVQRHINNALAGL